MKAEEPLANTSGHVSLTPEMIHHYRVIRKLGAGGMGQVYLAEDTRLGRKVALKFLTASCGDDPERRARFFWEARAASVLRSPNIATIYDIGEYEDSPFIVMEYVEGETLAAKVERGPVSLREAVDVAIQVVEALAEAHARGVIHCDIKATNLIITPGGLVKVLDFGIAKVTPPRGADERTITLDDQTVPGAVIGTVAYMSPEHVRGMAVDARTDLFALGVVLHEMVTGQLPFRGATTSDLIVSILSSEPPRLGQYLQNVPEELEGIVSKALRKNRDHRYQTAQEMLIDLLTVRKKVDADVLRRSVPGAGVSEPVPVGEQIPGHSTLPQNDRVAGHSPGRLRQHKGAALAVVVLAIIASSIAYFVQVKIEVESIAVAPFTAGDGDPQAQQIADGISENLVNELARFSELKVKSREAVAPYKERDPQTIGRELDVKAVLTGRVLRTGHNVSVVVELIDPRDNTQIWGEIYHRMNSDPTALQDEVSRLIIEEMQVRLSIGLRTDLRRHSFGLLESRPLSLGISPGVFEVLGVFES